MARSGSPRPPARASDAGTGQGLGASRGLFRSAGSWPSGIVGPWTRARRVARWRSPGGRGWHPARPRVGPGAMPAARRARRRRRRSSPPGLAAEAGGSRRATSGAGLGARILAGHRSPERHDDVVPRRHGSDRAAAPAPGPVPCHRPGRGCDRSGAAAGQRPVGPEPHAVRSKGSSRACRGSAGRSQPRSGRRRAQKRPRMRLLLRLSPARAGSAPSHDLDAHAAVNLCPALLDLLLSGSPRCRDALPRRTAVGAQPIRQAVGHAPYAHAPLVAAPPGFGDLRLGQGFDQHRGSGLADPASGMMPSHPKCR